MAYQSYSDQIAETIKRGTTKVDVSITPGITGFLLKDLDYTIVRTIFSNSLYQFDYINLTTRITVSLIVLNLSNVSYEVQINSRLKLLALANSSSVFVLYFEDANIYLQNKFYSSLNFPGNTKYILSYVTDLNKQFQNTSLFANYFSIPNRAGTDYKTIVYDNALDTPDIQFSGQENLFYTFTEGERDETKFWINNSYTVAYSKNTATESTIVAALGSFDIFPKMTRAVIDFTLVPGISNNDSDNLWNKQVGALRWILENDPTNLFTYMDQIEVFYINAFGTQEYIYYNKATSTTVLLSLPFTNGNYWNYIENAVDIQNGVYAPFYSQNPRIDNNADAFDGQKFNVNWTDFTVPNQSIGIKSNIDNPPIFLQGKLNLTFSGSDLTALTFTSFDDMGLTSTTYPNDMFVCNYSPYNELSFQNVLSILADPSITTPSYIFPGFTPPTYRPFPSPNTVGFIVP